jgi:hypothetical protein
MAPVVHVPYFLNLASKDPNKQGVFVRRWWRPAPTEDLAASTLSPISAQGKG